MNTFGTRDKIGYMLGDAGNDFFFILVSSFLMVYYTDILHIHAAAVGTIFFLARLWDAVADVAWGRFIDTRQAGKGGKFRPWIIRMSFPLVLSGICMFIYIPGMTDRFYLIYAFVTYVIWGTLYSTVNIPYGSMASVMTNHPTERTALSAFRTLGANISAVIVTVAGPLLLFVDNEAVSDRFTAAACLFGMLSLISYIACYQLSMERIVVPIQKNRSHFGQTVKRLMNNLPFLSLLLISLLFMISTLLLGAVNVYLFKDYFGNTKALSAAGLIQTVTVFMAMPLTEPLVRRFGKKEIASAGLLLAAVVYALLYMLPGLHAAQFLSVLVFGMFGYAFFQLVTWAFVTDVIDYHEYSTGLREDGTVYALYSFARKIGQAIAGGLGGYAVAFAGYDAESNVQTKAALDGIYTLATLVPAILFCIMFLLLAFVYPLNRIRVQQLTKVLHETSRKKRK